MPFWKQSASRDTSFDSTYRYETSWLLPPSLLFVLRALLSLYAFTTIFTIFGYNGANERSEDSERSFSFFTWLTYWGLAFYFLIAAVHTYSYWRSGAPFLAHWPRALQAGHGMFYSTIVVFPWIVTIVYWGLLFAPGHFASAFSSWTNTSQHALNAAYALFEIIFPRTAPPPFLHLVPVIIILGLYLALAYVTHATEGFYVYDFLDTETNSSGKVAGTLVGILVAAIIVFLIVRYAIMLRVWITEAKLGKTGKRSNRDSTPTQETGHEAEKGIPLHNVSAR